MEGKQDKSSGDFRKDRKKSRRTMEKERGRRTHKENMEQMRGNM
jgi:hypothetical protein